MKINNILNQSFNRYRLLRIRHILLRFLDFFGFNEIFRILNRKKFLILWYHGVSHRFVPFSNRHVIKSQFERQIKYLKRKKYKFITLTKLLIILKNDKNMNYKYAIINFDDGFKNVIKNAYPIMNKYNAKGCLYVVSSLIGKDQFLWTDYIDLLVRNSKYPVFNFKFKNNNIKYILNSESEIKYCIHNIKKKLRSLKEEERIWHLDQFNSPNKPSSFQEIPEEYLIANWEELKALNKNILEIGSHTKTHPNLQKLTSSKEFFQELYESKHEIEKNLGYKIVHLCYPAGSFNDITINNAKNFGYLTGTTTKSGLNSRKTDLYKLKRLQIDNNYTTFKAKVSGLYFFMKYVYNKVVKI